LQVFAVGLCVFHGCPRKGRIAILFNRAPPFKSVVDQHLAHSREINIALPKIAENTLPAGGVEICAFGHDVRLHDRIDILEMHVAQ